MSQLIIGLVGPAGSGKSTIAAQLVKKFNFVEVGLADILKRITGEVFQFTSEQLYGPSEMRNAPDRRYPRGPRQYKYPETPHGAVWFPLANAKGFTLIDAEAFEKVAKHSWWLNKKEEGKHTDYVRGGIDGTEIKLHTFLMGAVPDGYVVDHINGDGLDNRHANMRVCTLAENRQNERKRNASSASSPFKGVTWDAGRSKWAAKITVDGATKNLGRFDREDVAAAAYDRAARETFGAFARTNADLFLTPREALQRLGTEGGRYLYENIWIERALGAAQSILADGALGYTKERGIYRRENTGLPPAGVVISDVRFVNEVDAIRAAGGKIVRVMRQHVFVVDDAEVIAAGTPDTILKEHTTLSGGAAQHQSETELLGIPQEKFDYLFQNSSDMYGLRMQVDRMMDVFKGKIMEFDRGLQDAPPYLREKCKELAKLMTIVSLKLYDDEWKDGLEVTLWHDMAALTDETRAYVQELQKLKGLSEAVNGWFSWEDKTYDAPYFVKRGNWLNEYARRSQ